MSGLLMSSQGPGNGKTRTRVTLVYGRIPQHCEPSRSLIYQHRVSWMVEKLPTEQAFETMSMATTALS